MKVRHCEAYLLLGAQRQEMVIGYIALFWYCVSRAAAPEGTEGDEALWNIGGTCISVRLCVHERPGAA